MNPQDWIPEHQYGSVSLTAQCYSATSQNMASIEMWKTKSIVKPHF